MMKLMSNRTVLKTVTAILFVIACRLVMRGYSEQKNNSDHLQNIENNLVADAPERAPFETGKVQITHEEKKYYEHIPHLENLKLSPDVLKTERTNREIESEMESGGQWLVETLINMKHKVALQENRLLSKIHKSAIERQNNSNTSPDICVIKVLQLCKVMCVRMITEANKRWTKFFCKFSKCRFETKVGYTLEDIQESDVVFILPDSRDWKAIIESRPKGQLWVFHSKEAPFHGPEQSPPREFGNPFNISLTYMTSTDIGPAYHYFDTRYPEQNPKVLRKTKLMSWASSNCNHTSWGRTRFVHELEKYLDIDTYGLCGRLECPRFSEGCWSFRADYKFNLALENSQCPEYITEKFWYNALDTGTVPIVFGPPREDYERLAPPHSFIHVDDFKTVQEFTDYIHLLDHNDDLYLEYFAWRRLGRVEKSSPILTTRIQTGRRLCYIIMTLLKKSLSPDEYPWKDQHPNFHDWWHGLCPKDSQKRRIMDIDV